MRRRALTRLRSGDGRATALTFTGRRPGGIFLPRRRRSIHAQVVALGLLHARHCQERDHAEHHDVDADGHRPSVDCIRISAIVGANHLRGSRLARSRWRHPVPDGEREHLCVHRRHRPVREPQPIVTTNSARPNSQMFPVSTSRNSGIIQMKIRASPAGRSVPDRFGRTGSAHRVKISQPTEATAVAEQYGGPRQLERPLP